MAYKDAYIARYGPEKYAQMLARSRDYNRLHRDRGSKRAYEARYRARTKQRAFALFGSRCQHCGFDDIRALQIDHIQGVPAGLRQMGRNPDRGGSNLYRAILAGIYPREDFQLLCANCNWIKRAVNQEHNHWFYGDKRLGS